MDVGTGRRMVLSSTAVWVNGYIIACKHHLYTTNKTVDFLKF